MCMHEGLLKLANANKIYTKLSGCQWLIQWQAFNWMIQYNLRKTKSPIFEVVLHGLQLIIKIQETYFTLAGTNSHTFSLLTDQYKIYFFLEKISNNIFAFVHTFKGNSHNGLSFVLDHYTAWLRVSSYTF